MPCHDRFTRHLAAVITAVWISTFGLHARAEAADLDVPSGLYPTLQAAVAEAAGNGDKLNTIYIHGRATTTGQVTVGPVFDASRRLIVCPSDDEERATVESVNGSQPALFLDRCYNVTIRDLDILRNTTNAADLVRMFQATSCTVERSRLGSIWSVPGAAGMSVLLAEYPKDVVVRNCIFFSVYPGTFDKGIFAKAFSDDESSMLLYNNVVADHKVYGIQVDDVAGAPGALVLLRNNVVANHPDAVAEPRAYRSDVDGPVTIVASHNEALASAGFEEQLAFGARTIAGVGASFLRFNRPSVDPIFLVRQWVTIPAWDPNPDFYMLEPALNPMHNDAGDYGAVVADGAPHARDKAVTDDLQKNARPSGLPPHTDRGADQLEVGSLAPGPGVHWYSLTGAQPGTPPTVTLLPSSSPQQTDLEVEVHGFYYWTVQQAGQSFVRLGLRPDPALQTWEPRPDSYEPVPDPSAGLGRPELPILTHMLGGLCGNDVDPPEVEVLAEVAIPGPRIYPLQPGTDDHPGDPPPPFQWDQAWYQQTVRPYPPARAMSQDSIGRSSGLTLLRAKSYPIRIVPLSYTFHGVPSLVIAHHYRFHVPHGHCPAPQVHPVSRRIARQRELLLANHAVVDAYRPFQIGSWAGDYLFVTLPEHAEEIDPLVRQKRRRGYATTVVTTDVTGRTCEGIKDYIADWWSAGDPERDHYVLLVGDADDLAATDDLPTCTDENGNASDKIYACIDGVGADGRADPYPEVLLGRLPCDTETECSDMVSKILNYETGYPLGASWLDQVLLTSHEQSYPEEYTQNQNEVAGAIYSTPPGFTVLHGGEGHTDAEVIAEIEDGKGVVCYRGHGSTDSWSGWNGGSFGPSDVSSIDNGTKTPVVFSFACSNGAVNVNDAFGGCAGEQWLETTHRGVACYAASGGSSTSANHIMNKEMFKAIYDDDVVILGEAIAAEEAATIRATPTRGEKNAWEYLLFGDPELKVLREDVPPMMISMSASSVPTGPGTVIVHVSSGSSGARAILDHGVTGASTPVPLAIVTAYKDGEFVASRYTDANGDAQVPIQPASTGTIEITVTTEFDSYAEARDTVTVTSTTGLAEAGRPGVALALEPARPNPTRAHSSIVYVLPRDGRARLDIYDVGGRRVASLRDGAESAGRHLVAWDGRDDAGARLEGGVYFVRLEFEGRALSTRIARID